MTIVSEYDWESDTWARHNGDHVARAAWREAVQEIAERAKVTLPDCAGRVDAAVKLVEYRKFKRSFPPTARAHLVAHPTPPEATSQPFSRPRGPRGRLAGRPLPAQRAAQSRRLRVAGSGRAAETGANV